MQNHKKKAGASKHIRPRKSSPHIDYIDSLADLQHEVENTWRDRKLQSVQLSSVYKYLGLESRSERVKNCGSYLEFTVYDDKARLSQAFFCKDRFCSMCAWRRSLKIFGQVSRIMDWIDQHYNLQYLFLTLTVANCSSDDLAKTVQHLTDSYKYLYNKNRIFKNTVKGSFRTLEVTRNNKTGLWHPHLHIILAVPQSYGKNVGFYLTNSDWQLLWKKAAKLDYMPIVDIRKIRTTSKGAVAEVSKYSVKASDYLSGSFKSQMYKISVLIQALTNKRMIGYTGVFKEAFKALKLDDAVTGDLLHVEADDQLRPDLVKAIVKYRWQSGVYLGSITYSKSDT
jgi:plasmid rolling circle replication initiator protein Rep